MRPGVWLQRAVVRRAWHRDGPVAWQPVRPVLPFFLQRLADEERSKARAVNEQVAFDAFAGFELERRDASGLGVQLHIDNLAFGARCSASERIAAKVGREQGRVELVGIIVERATWRGRLEFGMRSHHVADRRIPYLAAASGVLKTKPKMVERHIIERRPEASEWVQIARADIAEIVKFNPELECRVRHLHEFGLVYSKAFDPVANVRESRLANAYDPDFFRTRSGGRRTRGVATSPTLPPSSSRRCPRRGR